LKKLMLLAALLAMVLVTAVPAIASISSTGNRTAHHNLGTVVSQEPEQSVESGDSSQTINVTGGGDNSNACQGIEGISNTGNAVNSTDVLQYLIPSDVEVDDSGNFEISPTTTTTCTQSVNQAASASG
jgi:hypothetical protein